MINETGNRGESGSSKNVTYTYTIPDSPIELDDTVNETWFEWDGTRRIMVISIRLKWKIIG